MIGNLLLKFTLLAFLAGCAMLVANRIYGLRPLFTAMMLVASFWLGHLLWGHFSKRSADLPSDGGRPGEG
jgi:hypothetical protein